MDCIKNYVISLIRAESKESKKVQSQRKAAFESKKSRKFEEQRGEFYFNPSDEGMSGAKTYSYRDEVEIKTVGGNDGLEPIDQVKDFNVMFGQVEPVTDESGYFVIFKTTEGEYGFHFETEEGTMIYGYASTLDELKSQVELLGKYLDLPSIPWDDFVAAVDGVNKDTDNESWRTEWKKGTGNDFGYDHNAPLIFKQTPDGKVSMTLGKNPYGEEGYIGEVDFEEDFIVQEEHTIEEVLDKLSDYGAVTNYFDLNMPSQDLLDYIESFNEEDFSMDNVMTESRTKFRIPEVQDLLRDTDKFKTTVARLSDESLDLVLNIMSQVLDDDAIKDFYEELLEYIEANPGDVVEVNGEVDYSSSVYKNYDWSKKKVLDPSEYDEEDFDESRKKMESQYYTYHLNCPITAVVSADSEDLARNILSNIGSIELDADSIIEAADGDVEIREITIDSSCVQNSDEPEIFDPTK